MILTKKISQYGRDYKIGKYITLGEFACPGVDTVYYDPVLIKKLDNMREDFKADAIYINSGYRSAYYNSHMSPPGAKNSKHIEGLAADVRLFKNGEYIPAKIICCYAQLKGFNGIGYISYRSVHLDTADRIYRGDETGTDYSNNVNNDFFRYFNKTKEDVYKYVPSMEVFQMNMNREQLEILVKETVKTMLTGKDTTVSKWAVDEMEAAKKLGITDGSRPKGYATREEVTAMIVRSKK